MSECVSPHLQGAEGLPCSAAPSCVAVPDANFVEKLRVYKQVCLKVRSSLVAGRDEIVSPASFLESLIESNGPKLVSSSGSIDSGIFPGEPSTGGDCPKTGAVKSERTGSRNSNEGSNECHFVETAEGWTIEYNDKCCESCGANAMCMCPRPSPNMELLAMAEAAYREHFYQREHYNFFAEEPDIGPCLLSVKREGEDGNFRLLIRSSDYCQHMIVSGSALCGGQCDDIMELVDIIGREMKLCMPFQPAQFPSIQNELLKIDETFVKNHHKIGVLNVKQGQTSEEEIFGNLDEPGPFNDFLSCLGERIELKGFKGFLGGLDNDRKLTGEYSVFTKFSNLEVMFHVATLLPYTPNDSQQVNKKRHIGNDIVCVVFLENANTVFNPTWVRSHFIHCYIVVQRVLGAHGQPLYKVAVTKRSTVPSFAPELKNTSVFAHSKTLQQFLLTKVVNGERASYHAPRFLKLTNRSRGQLLHEFSANFKEYTMACKQGRATRKVSKRSNWLPIGASRAPSPLMDTVREKYTNNEKLAEDFSIALRGCELADVMFVVGEEKKLCYGVKAILACRSRVFRTMFKEGKGVPAPGRFSSPLVRRKLPSSTQYAPLQGRKSRLPGLGIIKKKGSVPDDLGPGSCGQETNALTPLISRSFSEDPRHVQVKEQYVIEGFTELEFGELLNYLTTGSCNINHTNIVGLACVAERYEVEELRQACYDTLPRCLTIRTVCTILAQLEKYLAFASAKTMIIQCLEFVDGNAVELLSSEEMKNLSENMVHLVLRRDTDVPEVLKVKAAFAWGEVNTRPKGPDFKTLVTPLVKHVRLHLIDPQDIMKICVPSGIFDMDKVMTALAYQADPQSIETDSYTMFRPRKKSNVLSSR